MPVPTLVNPALVSEQTPLGAFTDELPGGPHPTHCTFSPAPMNASFRCNHIVHACTLCCQRMTTSSALRVSMLPASTRRFYKDHPSVTPQLVGYGAPRPSDTSNEEPLIKGHMRTFPDNHPSLGSVRNAAATGCPAIVHSQMDSSQWKTTTQATIDNREPTAPKRREGKGLPPPLMGTSDLYFEPREVYVAPPNAGPTIYRDQRVFKHMGTLTRQGKF
jgi:hypothetical protein